MYSIQFWINISVHKTNIKGCLSLKVIHYSFAIIRKTFLPSSPFAPRFFVLSNDFEHLDLVFLPDDVVQVTITS